MYPHRTEERKKASACKEICEYLLQALLHYAATRIDHRSYTGKTGEVPASTQKEMESKCESMHVCTSPGPCQRNYKLSTYYDLGLTHIFGHKRPYQGLLPTACSPAYPSRLWGECTSELWWTNSLGGAPRSFWDIKTQLEFQRFALSTTDDARTVKYWDK